MPYLTPNSIPVARLCRRIFIPDEPYIIAAVNGALYDLTREFNWQQYGEIEPAEIAQAMITMQHEYYESDGCMIGTILPYATTTNPPNTLPCNGDVFLRADYPALYDLLLPDYRVTATTFRTPDLRDKTTFGASATMPPASEGGSAEVTLSVEQMPEHYHTTEPHDHTSPPHDHTTIPHSHGEGIAVPTIVNGGLEAPAASASPAPSTTTPADVVVVSNSAIIQPATVIVNLAGGGDPHENMPPYIALNYCIVAR